MNNQGAHLTKHTFRNIARTLRSNAYVKAKFATFLRDQLKSIEWISRVLVSEHFVEKLMSFVQENKDGLRSKLAGSCGSKEMSRYGIRYDFTCIMVEGQVPKRYSKNLLTRI